MSREIIVEYLDKQISKHQVYECMPENETGYIYVPREALYKIVDGLIPLLKSKVIKNDKTYSPSVDDLGAPPSGDNVIPNIRVCNCHCAPFVIDMKLRIAKCTVCETTKQF